VHIQIVSVKYIIVSSATFDKLLVLFGPRVTFQDARKRKSVPPEERLTMTGRYKKTSSLFMIHILLFIVLSETVKNSEYSFIITVSSVIYLKIRMIDRVMHPSQLGDLLFFYLEYLTLMMCFVIGNNNYLSVVKKSVR